MRELPEIYRGKVHLWIDMRPGTWQLFNGFMFPFIGYALLFETGSFNKLESYKAMRDWMDYRSWAAVFIVIGFLLLISKVGSTFSRVGLFLSTLLWVVIGCSIYIAVGLSALGPPVYWTLAIFTARAFIKAKGVRSGYN